MAFPILAHILQGCGIQYLPKGKLIKLGHFQKATRNVLTALVIAGNHNMEDLNLDLGKGYLSST